MSGTDYRVRFADLMHDLPANPIVDELQDLFCDMQSEIARLTAKVEELEKDRNMAMRLMRARESRINAIRQTLDQNKGDDLVRVEARHFCDCPYDEIDAARAQEPADGPL